MKLLLRYIVFVVLLFLNYRGYGQEECLDSFPYLEYGFYLDEKPYFEEGKEALINWFNSNINYPSALSEHNLQVSFYFKVVSDTNGKISLINTFCGKVRNKVTEEYFSMLQDSVARTLNREIIRLIRIFPDFIPGRHAEKKRKISFIFTLKFNPQMGGDFIHANDPFIIPIYPPE